MCSAKENDIYKQAMRFGLAEEMERRPFKKNSFTGDYTPWINKAAKAKAHKNGEKVHECLGGDPLTSYLNSALVKEALHITAESPPWVDCEGSIKYTMLQKGSQWIYEALKGQIKMLHYSGDKDGCVPTVGTLNWINNLGWKEISPWREVVDAKATAGYFWQLDGLDFGTVHGAGHMVPGDEPKRAYNLIMNWILGNPIPARAKLSEDKEVII